MLKHTINVIGSECLFKFLYFQTIFWTVMIRIVAVPSVYSLSISLIKICNKICFLLIYFPAEHRTDYLVNPELLSHNRPLWNHCRRLGWRAKCLTAEFLNNFCSLFPVQVMKVLRAGPNITQILMEYEK